MPHIVNNITYLNTGEACKYLGWSGNTFQTYAKDTLQRHEFPGKGAVYYRQDDLQRFLRPRSQPPLEARLADVARAVLRNTPDEDLPPHWQALKAEVIAEGKELDE